MFTLKTHRLILRNWTEADAESLFAYAKCPDVGPIAGWPPHQSVEESLDVIRNVFSGTECYAICEKGSDQAIGAIELMLNGHTDRTERDEECELGYWLGKPFWGRGYMTEAAREILRHGFEEIGMNTIWCGYYEGNQKSKRVQEKLGFLYHHTRENAPVPLLHEVRTEHINVLTKEHWEKICGHSRGVDPEPTDTAGTDRRSGMQEKVIENLTSKNDEFSCAYADKVISESKETDKWYESFDAFASLLAHPKSLVRNRALHILAANAQWDEENRFDAIIEDYLTHITDEKPITARQCIKALVQIGLAKPQYIEKIVSSLRSADLSKYKDSMRPLIKKDMAETERILINSGLQR